MALEEEVPTTPSDATIPRYRQIDKRCKEYLAEFGEEFVQTFKSVARPKPSTKLPTGRKRAAPPVVDDDDEDEGKPKAKKKIKTESKSQGTDDGGMTDQQMAELNDRGGISKQSVVALKEFLKARGQSTSGKKIELVERTQEYLESKGL